MKYYYNEEIGAYKPVPEPPRMSLLELLETFPEGKDMMAQKLAEWQKDRKATLRRYKPLRDQYGLMPQPDSDFWEAALHILMPQEPWDQIQRLERLMFLNAKPEHKNIYIDRAQRVDAAKARNIMDLYGFQKLRRNYNRWTALCPFHHEKTGSFTIYANNNTWHCYSCGKGGDSIDFIMELKGCDMNAALDTLT